jgi:FlgD Ig-like domain
MNYILQTTENFIPISWSSWDGEMSPGAVDRFENYYGYSIYPTTIFGGSTYFEAWDCNTLNYEQTYLEQVDIPSPMEIELIFEQNRSESFTITANVIITEEITTTNNKIFFVITNWVEYSTDNPWYFLVVAASDEENFDLTAVGETGTYTAELSVTMQQDWLLEDLRAVAIVQNTDNKEILQAAQKQFANPNGVEEPIISQEISLRNYPNPFNPSTTISFDLSEEKSGRAELSIYNTKGQKVKELVNSKLPEGQYSYVWNGTNDAGKPVVSGVYYYRLYVDADDGGKYTSVKKVILLK